MATPDEIQKQLATRKPATVTPVGDVPAATARAAAPSPLTVPPTAPTAQVSAPAPAPAALPKPPDFIGDAAGNVQANTASANWRSAPGARRTFFPSQGPTSSAAQLTQAPNWQTTPGAGAPAGVVDPVAATRVTSVAPAANGGAGISLEGAPKPGPVGGADITADFTKRTAAARAGVDAGGVPRAAGPVSPGVAAAASDAASVAASTAPPVSAAERAGAAVGNAARTAGKVARLGTAPVETVPGRLGARTAPGQRGGSAGLLASIGIGSALGSLNRPTEDYRKRLGMDAHGGVLGDVAARTAGVLSDFGAAIPDSIIGLTNAAGLTSMRPFAANFADREKDFQPVYATDKSFAGSPRPSALTDADRAANQAWETNQLKAELAARTGQPAPEATPAATASPAAAAAQPTTTGSAAALTAAPGAAAQPAASTVPSVNGVPVTGTATINGRTLSAQEIADAGNRLNTVPSTAFTNPAVGTLFSEANGGATPTMDQAMALRQQLNGGGGGGRMFGTDASGNPVGTSGAGIGGPARMADRASTINDLMGQIHSALQSGRRRTANVLVAQLAAFDRASGGDQELAQRRAEAAQGPRRAPQTAAEQALETAQAESAGSQAEVAKISAAQARQAAKIQQQLQSETDPAKRKTLEQNLSAITGKGGANAADKLITLDIPVGSGLDAKVLKLPYDPSSNQLRVPNGYAELLQRLSGGQPQAK